MDVENQITDRTQLRTVYREPGQMVLDKVIDHVDDGAAGFIARSPFMALATSTEGRADASPRGGPPGFVRVLDEHHLAWGDLTGNNRLDSFSNIVERPEVGMMFIIPGVLETLRLRGTAAVVRDPDVLGACAIDGRLPRAAVVITVTECYIQCGAAIRRSGVWDTDTWLAPDDRPSGAAILKGHIGLDVPVEAIEADLATYYDNHIWAAGGRDD